MDREVWRDVVTRQWPAVALGLVAMLAVSLATAWLWYPPPPGSLTERALVALAPVGLLLAGALRLVVWLRLNRFWPADRAHALGLLLLAVGATLVVATGGAVYEALHAALPTAALVGLAAALFLAADLARLQALDPPISEPVAPAAEPATPDQPPAAAAWAPALPRLGALSAADERTLLGGLLVVMLALRLVMLDRLPASMTADEADNMQVILRILSGLGPGLFGFDWKPAPAFSVYLMAPAVWLSGLSLAGLRLTSAVLSTLALLPFYLVARQVVSAWAALAAAALLGGGLWYLHFSRSGWENVHLCLYALLLLWLLGRAVKEGHWRLYAWAGGALALGLYGYFAGRTLPLAVLASLPLAIALHRSAWRRIVAGYGLTLAVAALLFVPQLISASRDWILMTGRVGTVAITTMPRPYLGETELSMIVLRQIERTVRAFLLMDPSFNTSGLNQRYLAPGWPFLDPATAVLYIAGLILGARRWRATWLWWPMLLVPLGATQVLSAGTPDGARALLVAPVMLLFVALAIDWLIGEQRQRQVAWAAGLVVGVTVIVGYNVVGYVAWQTSPTGASSRQPAVPREEYDLWRDRQLAAARAGQWGFSLGEWERLRASGALPAVPTPVPAVAPVAATVPLAPTPVTATAVVTLAERLADPRGVTVDARGVIYVVEAGAKRVARFDHTGRPLDRWGGPGTGDGQFEEPVAVVVDRSGALHVLDAGANQVQVLSPEGRFQARYGGDLRLYRPRGLALGDDGLLYLSDTGGSRVLRLEANGTLRDSLPAQPGARPALFDQPTAALGLGGTIYVAEPTQRRLQRVTPAGQPAGPPWALAETDTLYGSRLGLGPDGELVVTDVGAQRVLIVCPSGAVLAWAAPGGSGRLVAATLGADQTLYLADSAGQLQAARLASGCG